ncbi:DUF4328 domain-containing protein [Actinomadura scrupuli]|uniref:DUF4328 domain-containing protein n=1 Tax=Actinomadura scrupuli TaxID=559629 RepID=UPI003D99E058
MATTVVFTGWFVIEVVWAALGLRLSEAGTDKVAYRAHIAPYEFASEVKLYGYLLAAAVFVCWLFRARLNAEIIRDYPHRWGRSWLVLGWIVPLLNFWIPRQVVGDVWRASDSAGLDRPAGRRPWPVYAWWIPWLLNIPLGAMVGGTSESADLIVFSAGNAIIAGVLALAVVWQISLFQEAHAARIVQALSDGPTVPGPTGYGSVT